MKYFINRQTSEVFGYDEDQQVLINEAATNPDMEDVTGSWPPPAATPTPEQIIDAFRRAIDAHVEAQARAWQYNSAAHLASYVASTVAQWAAEATAFVAWRDAVWTSALALLADVQSGTAEPPADPADFIATLPALVRPT